MLEALQKVGRSRLNSSKKPGAGHGWVTLPLDMATLGRLVR